MICPLTRFHRQCAARRIVFDPQIGPGAETYSRLRLVVSYATDGAGPGEFELEYESGTAGAGVFAQIPGAPRLSTWR